jgi:peptidyl-prolyl cis-trans isomerase SurA
MSAINRMFGMTLLGCIGLCAVAGASMAQAGVRATVTGHSAAQAADSATIIAVVNGDVISKGDLDNRRRLFAISTGMPASADVLDRLTPQITRQLIDERLRLQEMQRRKIYVSDKDIADAIAGVEQRNNMPSGALARKLAASGVDMHTLIDQIRVQIGWNRVLRQVLSGTGDITATDIDDQERLFKEQIGKPEYRLGEIFVPISEPSRAADAQKFADTVIQQLRAGAPFAVVAAQFSASQTALQGGDLGWVEASQLDPAVLKIVQEMPEGAISNPVRVPGGLTIVTLRAKREIGKDESTIIHLRQVFFPFATNLDPANPTEQQKAQLDQAKRLSASAKTCDDMDAANKAAGSARPADPGEVRLEGIGSPPLRQLLATLPEAKPSQPVVAQDGIAVIMVCSRENRNASEPSKQEIADRLLSERVELASQQLQRDLERRAVIDQRT